MYSIGVLLTLVISRACPKLICVARYHYHGSGPWQINVQLQLMMALLTDLGLNKASLTREKQDALLDEIKHPERAIPHPSQALYVGHRAVLGCFYLFSSVRTCAPHK